MLAAVAMGGFLSRLPAGLVAAISATSVLPPWPSPPSPWKRSKPRPAEPAEPPPCRWSRGALVSFAAIFFPEWGDAGQLAAAMLAAQHRAPGVVWLGATLAMVTKATLAVTLGIGLRRYVSQRVVRIVTVLVCVAMGRSWPRFRIEI